MDNDNFYMHLPSNSSENYFPHNTISRYTTKLPQTIEFDGQWEVGLAEIMIPLYFDNVVQFEASDKVFSFPAMQYPDVFSFLSILFRQVVDKTDSTVATACIEEFINEAKNVLPTDDKTIVAGFSTQNKVAANPLLTQQYVQFPPVLYGSPRQLIGALYGGAQNHATAVSIRDYILNVCEGYKTAVSTHDADALNALSVYTVDKSKALTTQHLQLIYVYCDIIAYQYTGDLMARLLRVIHHNADKSKNNGVAHYLFQPVYYIPVAVNSFETIEISLQTEHGQPLPFRTGPTPAHVVLHFRRRQQQS